MEVRYRGKREDEKEVRKRKRKVKRFGERREFEKGESALEGISLGLTCISAGKQKSQLKCPAELLTNLNTGLWALGTRQLDRASHYVRAGER